MVATAITAGRGAWPWILLLLSTPCLQMGALSGHHSRSIQISSMPSVELLIPSASLPALSFRQSLLLPRSCCSPLISISPSRIHLLPPRHFYAFRTLLVTRPSLIKTSALAFAYMTGSSPFGESISRMKLNSETKYVSAIVLRKPACTHRNSDCSSPFKWHRTTYK